MVWLRFGCAIGKLDGHRWGVAGRWHVFLFWLFSLVVGRRIGACMVASLGLLAKRLRISSQSRCSRRIELENKARFLGRPACIDVLQLRH